jgi:hypothetical protein
MDERGFEPSPDPFNYRFGSKAEISKEKARIALKKNKTLHAWPSRECSPKCNLVVSSLFDFQLQEVQNISPIIKLIQAAQPKQCDTQYRGRRVPFSCFARPKSFSAVPTMSGPAFMFCALGYVFGGMEGVGSRFHVLRSRTHFRR